MKPLRVVFVAFWLFCVASCIYFLYTDYFPADEPAQPSVVVKQGEKPAPKGDVCPLGFGGDGTPNPHAPPVNPPIPEQTVRDPKDEAVHRKRCNILMDDGNHAAALGCFASEVCLHDLSVPMHSRRQPYPCMSKSVLSSGGKS